MSGILVLPSTFFVVPTAQADGLTKFGTLAGAVAVAKPNDIIQIEPNSAPGNGTLAVPLTLEGDPNFGPATLPLIPSLTVADGTSAGASLTNLALGDVTLANGTVGTTISHCQVANITEAIGSLNGGSNTINENVITGGVTLGGNTATGLTSNDQVINNTFTNNSPNTFLFLYRSFNVVIQGNTITGAGTLDRGIDFELSTGSILHNTILLSGSSPTPQDNEGIFVFAGAGGLTRAAIRDNRISTNGGTGIFVDAQFLSGLLGVGAEANDFVGNGVGVSVIGNGAGSFDDFGEITVFDGNDFHGYTASSPAIVVNDQGATTTDGVFAELNIFSVSDPTKVVQAGGGKIDVSNPLSPNQAFVDRLYENFLQRQGTLKELNGWVSLIPSLGQSGVASAIIHSAEADARLVDQLYLQYLGRAVDRFGELAWVKFMQAGHTEEDVIAGLLSSDEFFSRAGTLANPSTPSDPNANFIRALYETLLNRAPSAGDISAWETVLATSGRTGVANGITHSVEYRSDQVTSFYVNFLHRGGSAKEIASWAGSSLDLLSIEVGFTGSKEFFTNG